MDFLKKKKKGRVFGGNTALSVSCADTSPSERKDTENEETEKEHFVSLIAPVNFVYLAAHRLSHALYFPLN